MKKLIKILLYGVAVLVVLIIGAAIAIPLFVDPNDHKDRIVALAEKYTGRKLALEGDIGLSVFPWLGVELGKTTLSNAPGFGDQPMLQTDELQIRVQLLPLLKNQVQMDTIVLQGMRLNLARNEQGVTNWDDLLAQADEQAEPAEPAGDGPQLASLALGGIDIVDAAVTWDDRSAGERYVIDALNVETGTLEMNEPIDLELSMTIVESPQQISGDVALQGEVVYDLDRQRYRIEPIEFSADLSGEGLPGGAARVALGGDVSADLQAESYVVKDLALDAELNGQQVELRGDLAADMKAGQARISGLDMDAFGSVVKGDLTARNLNADIPLLDGTLNVQATDVPALLTAIGQDPDAVPLKSFDADVVIKGSQTAMNIEKLMAKAVLEGDAIPGGAVDLTLDTVGSVDLNKETLDLSRFSVQGLGLDVNGRLSATGIQSEPKLNGALTVAPFNLRQLLTQLGQQVPETADAEALTSAALSTKIGGSGDDVRLQSLELTLDQTKVLGQLAIANFEDPAIDFDLKVDAINADRYLPPEKDEKAKGDEPTELPLETLRKLKMKGSLTIGELTLAGAKMTNVVFNINARDGQVAMSPLAAAMYEGTFQGSVNIDATGRQAVLGIKNSLQNVQAGPLLDDLQDGEGKIEGTATLNSDLRGVGNDSKQIKQTLSGKAQFDFRDGALRGFNLAQILREAKAKLSGNKLSEEERVQKTDFSELSGTAVFDQGIMRTRDLTMKSPYLRVVGDGQSNLTTERLHYTVTTTVVGTAKGAGGPELAELAGFAIPVKVSGTFDDPSFSPDLGGMLKAKAEQEVKDKVAEELGDSIPEELGGLLGIKKKEKKPAAAEPAGDGTAAAPAPAEAAAAPAASEPAPAQEAAAPAPEAKPKEEKKEPEDLLKDALKDLLD